MRICIYTYKYICVCVYVCNVMQCNAMHVCMYVCVCLCGKNLASAWNRPCSQLVFWCFCKGNCNRRQETLRGLHRWSRVSCHRGWAQSHLQLTSTDAKQGFLSSFSHAFLMVFSWECKCRRIAVWPFSIFLPSTESILAYVSYDEKLGYRHHFATCEAYELGVLDCQLCHNMAMQMLSTCISSISCKSKDEHISHNPSAQRVDSALISRLCCSWRQNDLWLLKGWHV